MPGNVEVVTPTSVSGWVFDSAADEVRIVRAVLDGRVIAQGPAGLEWPAARILGHHGYCGFFLTLPSCTASDLRRLFVFYLNAQEAWIALPLPQDPQADCPLMPGAITGFTKNGISGWVENLISDQVPALRVYRNDTLLVETVTTPAPFAIQDPRSAHPATSASAAPGKEGQPGPPQILAGKCTFSIPLPQIPPRKEDRYFVFFQDNKGVWLPLAVGLSLDSPADHPAQPPEDFKERARNSPRAILHVGMHKTGTSSIQQALGQGLLSSPLLDYADLGHVNHSIPIQSLFTSLSTPHPHADKLGEGSQDIFTRNAQTSSIFAMSLIRAALAGRSLLVSGEDISCMSAYAILELRRYLSSFYDEILVVAYIRPPASYFQSAFMENIRQGIAILHDFSMTRPLYRQRFEKFDQIFGPEAVHLWLYNPERFPDGDVVRDFARRLGLQDARPERCRSNTSLSREALQLLYIYRRFGPGTGVGDAAVNSDRLLQQRLRSIGRRRFAFCPECLNSLVEQNIEDIRWMEQRMQTSLLDDVSLEPHPDCIASEDDLLVVDEQTIAELRSAIGQDADPSRLAAGSPPSDIALQVCALLRGALEEQLRDMKASRDHLQAAHAHLQTLHAARCAELETRHDRQERTARRHEASLVRQQARLEASLDASLAEISALRASWSWRLTAPLRFLCGLLRKEAPRSHHLPG